MSPFGLITSASSAANPTGYGIIRLRERGYHGQPPPTRIIVTTCTAERLVATASDYTQVYHERYMIEGTARKSSKAEQNLGSSTRSWGSAESATDSARRQRRPPWY